MLKKICLYIFLGGIIIGAITAIVGVIQFKGNAVGAEHDLYVSSRTDYTEVLDSLLPHIKHHAAFRFYARHIGLEKSYKEVMPLLIGFKKLWDCFLQQTECL